jgi:hypothetical protein
MKRGEFIGKLLFPTLRQNLGGHKFKDDREVEKVVTRWLIIHDTDFKRKQKSSFHDMINASLMAETVWGSAGRAVPITGENKEHKNMHFKRIF